MLQQLGADAVGIHIGLIHLVDGHDDRHFRRLGVVDGFDGLRHDAVITGHHEDDDIRCLGAAGAHGGESLMARRIKEGDALTARHTHLIGTDMLGDAAGFARHHIGLAQGVEERCLAVVNVTHDGNDRGTGLEVGGIVGLTFKAHFHIRLRHALDRVAHILREELGGVGVQHVVDLHHLALLHQQPDHIHRAFGHAVGQLLHRNRVRNGDFAMHLDLLSGPRAGALLALLTAAHGCQRALTRLVIKGI